MRSTDSGRTWWPAMAAVVAVAWLPVAIDAQRQSVGVTTAGQAITVDRDGDFVRVRTPGQQVDVAGDWRQRVTVSRDASDALLVELGAHEADGAIRVALSGDVLFDFDSAVVRPAAATALGRMAQVIRDRSRGDVYVVGHTDSVGADAHNQKLSEDRAAAVIAWLSLNEGIPAGLMLGRGMGESRPVAYNVMPDGADNPNGRAQNRRVEILLATRDDVDLRGAVEVTRVDTGGSPVVVERSAGRQTVQVGGRTIDVQQRAGGSRVQVGDTVVDVPQAAATQGRGAVAPTGDAATSTAATSAQRRAAEPVECSGMRAVELDAVVIDTAGVAVQASGTCRVVIRNSEIRSRAVAIAASGMSQVEIVDSIVIGREGSVEASGTSRVSARGSEFTGAVSRTGLASFDDRGGNRLP